MAIDRSKHAYQLINQSVKLAKFTNAKIWILHVTEPDPDNFLARESGPQHVYEKRVEERKKEASFIKQWTDEIIKNQNIPAEGLLIEGPIIKTIKSKVEEHDIDLIVAGHQRKNFLYGLFTANKKKDLVDELKIPLLAVPLVEPGSKAGTF